MLPLSPIRLVDRAVTLFGQRTAVVDYARVLTYAEFGERCRRLAAGLQRLGVDAGDTIAFLCFNRCELLEGYFAPAMLGAAVAPLNARLNAAELRVQVELLRPEVLIYEAGLQTVVRSLSVKRSVALGVEYETLLAAAPLLQLPLRSTSDDVTAAVFFTSGTEGEPKPVRLSHRNIYLHALALSAAMHRKPDAVELQAIPLFHANGWGRVHVSVLHGNLTVLPSRFDPQSALQLMKEQNVTDTAVVPTMAHDLLQWAESTSTQCLSTPYSSPPCLREIHLGGADCDAALVERLRRQFQCRVTIGYGMTEANSTIAYDGMPLPGMEIRVDERGELLLRGDTLAVPVAQDGWFHTGDLGQWTSGGRLLVTGRLKDVIIRGGEKIVPAEVERAINAHPAVAESAVFGVPDARWGEAMEAVVIVREPLEAAALDVFLKERLARFKLPRRIHISHRPLPRNGGGKILKRILYKGWVDSA